MTTTLDSQFQKSETVTRLWATLMPGVPAPDAERAMRWSVTYADDVIVHGIRRASKKLYRLKQEGAAIGPEGLYRYADSVMSAEHISRQPTQGEEDELRREIAQMQNDRRPMVLRIINALTRHRCASRMELTKLCNVIRDGSGEEFAKAMQVLYETQTIRVATNRTGTDFFMLNDGAK